MRTPLIDVDSEFPVMKVAKSSHDQQMPTKNRSTDIRNDRQYYDLKLYSKP